MAKAYRPVGTRGWHPNQPQYEPKRKGSMTLTPAQVEFLRAVMQDYIDVTQDCGIRRKAKEFLAKIEKLAEADRAGATK